MALEEASWGGGVVEGVISMVEAVEEGEDVVLVGLVAGVGMIEEAHMIGSTIRTDGVVMIIVDQVVVIEAVTEVIVGALIVVLGAEVGAEARAGAAAAVGHGAEVVAGAGAGAEVGVLATNDTRDLLV